MRQLKLGFALEGNSDYSVIQCLAQRLIEREFPNIPLAENSVLRPRKRGHGFIKDLPTFARQLQADGVDILVVVVDTDDTLIKTRRKLLRQAKSNCTRQGIAICIAEGLAVRQLEAWLLADKTALLKVFEGEYFPESFPKPETIQDPKKSLNRLVYELTDGREITFASFGPELAEAIDLKILRKKCPHFEKWARNLKNCVKAWQRGA